MAKRRNRHAPTGPDPFRGALFLRVAGRRAAGALDFYLREDHLEFSPVPRVLWQTLLVLAEFRKRYSSVAAYLSAADLAAQLNTHEQAPVLISQDAVKRVFRLRKFLDRLEVAKKLADAGYLDHPQDFAKTLIEQQDNLGYRLNLPANQLFLDLTVDDRDE